MFLIPACVLLAVALLLCAGTLDLAFRTIPNWLPCALACDGAVLHVAQGTLEAAALAGAAVFLACAVLWRCGVMGGGDVKLFAAAALAVPAAGTFLTAATMAGGLLALAYAGMRLTLRARKLRTHAFRGRPTSLVSRVLRVERRRITAGSLPYGCAIAAGAILTFGGV